MRDCEKLVKALRCCSKIDARNNGCDSCPYEYCGEDCQNLCGNAADAIEELQAAVPKWISVEDELPEKNANYLTYGVFLPLGVKAMDMFRFDGDHWMVSEDVKITHWMPLPEPPKEMEVES